VINGIAKTDLSEVYRVVLMEPIPDEPGYRPQENDYRALKVKRSLRFGTACRCVCLQERSLRHVHSTVLQLPVIISMADSQHSLCDCCMFAPCYSRAAMMPSTMQAACNRG
jgi:hypothetical protein